ncbi:transposase domain-containing protein [Ochrobactrum sp. MC-1LL]|nr:transposase domain-containing protein [Ochrobactrum sp. MC-1LL]NKE75606.1 transposase domain-containing protein [Ochrobactrum sp. MC-1LL]
MLTCRACGVDPFTWLNHVLTVSVRCPPPSNYSSNCLIRFLR